MKYSTWWAAFSSCVDETSLSPQFKMLWLESCLEGEVAETVRGLGYSSEAYEAAKARLNRKYGGNRRQVQAHIEELRKLKPINAENPRELGKFEGELYTLLCWTKFPRPSGKDSCYLKGKQTELRS